MFFVLSKILLFLIKPIVWVFCLLFFAVLSKNASKRKQLLTSSLIIFLLFSNGFFIGKIFNAYEATYPNDEKYDVGIVLGGFSGINKITNSIKFYWTADRLFQAIKLYKSGKIKKILITGGSANLIDTKIKESDLVLTYLKEIGIPDSVIMIENQSRNTVENAALTFKLLHNKLPKAKLLIITSAWHIPRAKIAFSKYFGKETAYYPTNYVGKTDYDLSDYLIPSAEALSNWELIFKEWIGLVVDKLRA